MPHIPKMTEFYQKAQDMFYRTQKNQIEKGAQKYKESFNPHSWSADALLNHALEETVDLTHYLVGLHEKLVHLEEENKHLKEDLALLRSQRTRNINYEDSPFVQEDLKARYMDLDD